MAVVTPVATKADTVDNSTLHPHKAVMEDHQEVTAVSRVARLLLDGTEYAHVVSKLRALWKKRC
jgi:hypothetical protein